MIRATKHIKRKGGRRNNGPKEKDEQERHEFVRTFVPLISRLGMDLVGLVSIATQHQLSYLFTALTTFTCLFGYYKGNAFGKDGPVLLKAFNND